MKSGISDNCMLPKGRVTITMNGERKVFSNLVVDGYKEYSSKLNIKDFADPVRSIAVGTGGHILGDITTPVPPQLTDPALETELLRKDIGAFSNPTTTTSKYSVTFTTFEANGEITEAGLFTDAGLMVARVTFSNVTKTIAQNMLIEWELIY